MTNAELERLIRQIEAEKAQHDASLLASNRLFATEYVRHKRNQSQHVS